LDTTIMSVMFDSEMSIMFKKVMEQMKADNAFLKVHHVMVLTFIRGIATPKGMEIIDKSVSGKLEQDFIVQKEKIYSSTENLKIKPFQFSIHAALGIQYNINPTLGAFIEPGAAFYFKDGSFKNTIRDKHPLHFNLQLGVRWNY
jgi:hypothetical protein